MSYQYDFQIAGITMRWQMPFPLQLEERYQCFVQKDGGEPDLTVQVWKKQPVRDRNRERLIFDGARYRIWETDTHRYRETPYIYGCPDRVVTLVQEITCKKIWQLYLPDGADGFFRRTIDWIFYMAFEEILYTRGRVLLHASYVDTPAGALLFTGPSGIGKSTQAKLWEQCGGGTVMNGDRTILYKQGEVFLAAGSPCAGTSEIYRNVQSPIRAIVVLEQGLENRIVPLYGRNALLPLMRESTFPYMDTSMKTAQMELLCAVIEHVPIYRYTCREDSSAVEALRMVLEEEFEDE